MRSKSPSSRRFSTASSTRRWKAYGLSGALVDELIDRFYPAEEAAGDPPVVSDPDVQRYLGSYRWLRVPRKGLGKILGAGMEARVRPAEDGAIHVSFGGLPVPANTLNQVEPGVFRARSGGEFSREMAFRTTSDGTATHLFAGLFAFERVAWYESTAFLAPAGLLSLVTFLLGATFWPLASSFAVSAGGRRRTESGARTGGRNGTQNPALGCVRLRDGGVPALVTPSASFGQADRETWQPPGKIMDAVGVKPGMRIGEAGAGRGYFTFPLARRVGPDGVVFANDISTSSLDVIRIRASAEGLANIRIVVGEVEDPLFPDKDLDKVVMVYVLHMLEKPAEFMQNVRQYIGG